MHSKLAIVDDHWMSIGSANFVDISFRKDHSELCVAVWDPVVVKQLRVRLFLEHTAVDVSNMDGTESMEVLLLMYHAQLIIVGLQKSSKSKQNTCRIWEASHHSRLSLGR